VKFSAGTGVAEKSGHWWPREAKLSGQRSAVSGQRSAVSGQRSAVSGQRSAVSGQRSAISGQRSAIMSVGEYPLQALNEHCCTRSGSTAGGHNPRF
jgi:hypothetical protein